MSNAGTAAYRPDIDGLRAFAVLAVVGYHAFPAILPGGFIGVDVFFVISGYLISGIILKELQQGTFRLWNFYQRRILRIFPALIIVLAAALVLGWFILFPDEYRALGKHAFGGAFFVDNFLLWQEAGYFDVEANAKPLLHLWSLGIEEQFYIMLPLLLWYCAKKHFRTPTVIAVICIFSFLLNVYYIPKPEADFYNPFTRAWELLAGAVLCIAMRHESAMTAYLKDNRRLNSVLAVFGVILLVCALLLARSRNPYPGWCAVLPVLGAMSLLAAGGANSLP